MPWVSPRGGGAALRRPGDLSTAVRASRRPSAWPSLSHCSNGCLASPTRVLPLPLSPIARLVQEDEGVLGFVVAAIQRHRFTPAVPYVDWPWDTCSARHLGASRSAKQCRERWANVLNPFMKHDEPWTAAEMDLLIRLHGTFGNKWREIAKRCPGRSTNKVSAVCLRRAECRDDAACSGHAIPSAARAGHSRLHALRRCPADL